MKKTLVLAVAGAVVMGSTLTHAAVSDAEFERLKADFASLANRLNALEQENTQLKELSDGTITELALARTEMTEIKGAAKASSVIVPSLNALS